jgi:hypothetical protein
VTQILLPVEVILAFRISHFSDTYLGGYRLQFTVIVYLTREAVERVVSEHQFDDVLSEFLYARRIRENMVIGHHGRMAGGHSLRWSVGRQGDIHTADSACAVRLQVGSIAERWHRVFAEVAFQERQNSFTFPDIVGFVVDIRCESGTHRVAEVRVWSGLNFAGKEGFQFAGEIFEGIFHR